MKTRTYIPLVARLALVGVFVAPTHAAQAQSAEVIHHYTLSPTSLEQFGYSAADLAAAQSRGLSVTDQPAIGSGLERLAGNFYLGITDRGPSFTVGSMRIFPLPQFTPTIVLFQAVNESLTLQATLPLVGQSGRAITGIPNSATEDSSPFLDSTTPIPFNPDGVDIEDVHTLPGGRFIAVEEYSPSVLIISETGEVLKRYTPLSKTVTGADYPIANTLPDMLKNRRANRGFESIAVSADGQTAYTLTQSPLGPTTTGSPQRDSRVVRILRMNISDPLSLHVTGEFVALLSNAADYPPGNAQRDLKVSAAAWVTTDILLFLELNDVRGVGGVRLVLVDLREASNVQGLAVADTLDLEDVTKGPAFFGLTPAASTVVFEQFETDQTRLLPSGKLEGLAILNANLVAISNDNDFGLGDGHGTPSTLTVLRLDTHLPVLEPD